MDGFYQAVEDCFSPGDIFSELPFPILKFPLSFFRLRNGGTEHSRPADCLSNPPAKPKDGDSPRGTILFKRGILLSHGCEIDNLLAKDSPERRHWLAAPVEPFAPPKRSERLLKNIREGTQPNKFYLPQCEYLGKEEHFVDLRRITPINIPYFEKDSRLCGLTEVARLALQSELGVFFSGLALYVQPISCPECGVEIDPGQFLVPSGEEDND